MGDHDDLVPRNLGGNVLSLAMEHKSVQQSGFDTALWVELIWLRLMRSSGKGL